MPSQDGKCTVPTIGKCTGGHRLRQLQEAGQGTDRSRRRRGQSRRQRELVRAGVPMEKPKLVAAISEQRLKSVCAVFANWRGGGGRDEQDGPGRLLKTLWHEEYNDERDARFINDRVHANIQKDGTFSVVPRIYGGVTTRR